MLDQNYSVSHGAAATYEFISADEQETLSLGRAGIVHTRIQFVCYASTRAAANAAARAMKNSGVTAIKGVYTGCDIRGVSIEEGIRTDVEAPTDGQSEWRYLAEFDLMVSYLE